MKNIYKQCTELETTDGFGILSFPGSHSKSAEVRFKLRKLKKTTNKKIFFKKFIRVEIETKVEDMIEYMYDPNGWNLPKPQLILGVTGGAQKFTIPNRMKKAFKRGLIKTAETTGAWIISGGTNAGVMRLVGEAVADEFKYNSQQKLVVLGIASWGKIALRDEMKAKVSL